MYYILDNSFVIRSIDNKQVAPCESAEDFDFLTYIIWIEDGNIPENVTTTPVEV